MAAKLTKAEIELLKSIRDASLTGFYTTIDRMHPNHFPNARALRSMGLLFWENQRSPVTITAAGLAALSQHQGGTADV